MQLDARLRAYAAFVRRKSFSDAASELRISQPAVSKHIADLERELGVKLVERRTRSLTEAGEYLASHVVRAEALLKQSVRGLASLRDPMAGTVSIIASGTPGTYVLPSIVAAFSRQAVQEELASGTLVEIPFGSWRVRRLFSLVRIRDAALTPAAQEFADTLRMHCRALAAPRPQLRKRGNAVPGRPYRTSR